MVWVRVRNSLVDGAGFKPDGSFLCLPDFFPVHYKNGGSNLHLGNDDTLPTVLPGAWWSSIDQHGLTTLSNLYILY